MDTPQPGTWRPHRAGTLKTLAAFLVVLVLLPTLFYSAYQLSTLSEDEQLIEEIYRQQLDVVLFSINQYAWDVVNSWFGNVRRTLADGMTVQSEKYLREMIRSSRSIQTLFATDTAASEIYMFLPSEADPHSSEYLLTMVNRHGSAVQRLLHRLRTGYQTVDVFRLGDSPSTIVLLTTSAVQGAPTRLIGLVIDVDAFISFVLAPKLSEAAGDDFVLAVTGGEGQDLVYATTETDPARLRQSRDLWILPGYALWVHLQSGTIEEVASSRFVETLVLVVALDLLLVGGVWFVFRLVRREVELTRLKSDFISSVSHELRTPLSLIRMSAETLLMGRVSTPERTLEHHQIIVRETDRLTRLVNNVLLFSRLESGKTKLELTDADLNLIVRTILDDYGSEFSRRGFTVETRLTETPAWTKLNGEAVTEALLNLLDNGMKFSEGRSTLRISTGFASGEVYVEVEDFGIGIPREQHKKIFERFYRVSPGPHRQKRGSGLGLTLVRQIMDAHGGRVSVGSEPGKGSAFRLTFGAITDTPTQS